MASKRGATKKSFGFNSIIHTKQEDIVKKFGGKNRNSSYKTVMRYMNKRRQEIKKKGYTPTAFDRFMNQKKKPKNDIELKAFIIKAQQVMKSTNATFERIDKKRHALNERIDNHTISDLEKKHLKVSQYNVYLREAGKIWDYIKDNNVLKERSLTSDEAYMIITSMYAYGYTGEYAIEAMDYFMKEQKRLRDQGIREFEGSPYKDPEQYSIEHSVL